MNDVLDITHNVARFAFRDQGRWEELRDLFHPNASIAVTWYSGPIEGFIERSAKMAAANRSTTSKHLIGASMVTIEGNRALSDTDVTILARANLGPIEADMTSYLRFFDRVERRDDGIWRIASRTAIYEKDRIDPVRPSLLYPLAYRLAGFNRFPAPTVTWPQAWCAAARFWRSRSSKPGQKRKRRFGRTEKCGLPHDIEFPGASLHCNPPFVHDQLSEGRILSSSFAIDGKMRADSIGVFFFISC